MKMGYILLLSIPLPVFSQEADFSEEVAIYLERYHSLDQYVHAYDELLKILEKQYPRSAQHAEAWNYLGTNKEKAVAELKSLLIPVYVRNFSKAEIKDMILFYESETGLQLVSDRSKMTELQQVELHSYYNGALGKKIIEKQKTLAQEIGIVSQGRSRDLYETAMSPLKN